MRIVAFYSIEVVRSLSRHFSNSNFDFILIHKPQLAAGILWKYHLVAASYKMSFIPMGDFMNVQNIRYKYRLNIS